MTTGTERLDENAFYRQEWVGRAACRGLDDPAIFFAPDRESGYAVTRRVARAKSICGGCPVLMQCRSYALDAHEPDGVWGGLSANERTIMRRRRARPGAPALVASSAGSAP